MHAEFPTIRYNTRAMNAVPESYIDTALAAADAARVVTRRYFRARLDIGEKDDRTPVTIADRETERVIRDMILARHPAHGFLGEEGGASGHDEIGSGGDEWRWVVDPIDGTKSFATGNPTFGTLIALLRRGRAVLGIIDHAALDERWIGIAGRATTHNGVPCATNSVTRLADATLHATTPDMFTRSALARFDLLSQACRFRVFGGDCYAYGLLSCGFAGLVCEALQPHDYLALIPVVEGAGGVISDWQGKRLTLHSNGEVLAAANGALHRAALACLRQGD